MQIYQDIWVNGVVQTKGIRDCAGRYKPILAHCQKYNRPFTVLDIGANLGYFSSRLASDFDCTSVMIEGAEVYQRALLKLVKQQECRENLILLGVGANLATLRELCKCEHFDVVLAMRVVHHFKENFHDVIDTIVSLGDFVFMELPTAGEDEVRASTRVKKELSDHSKALGNQTYNKVGEFSIHVGSSLSPMYLIENSQPKQILSPFYGSPRNTQHQIESTFENKKFFKKDSLKRGELVNEWVPGINLYTFHKLNGIFPDRKRIARKIKGYNLPTDSPLTDITPWNFILNGCEIVLIDHTSVNNSLGKPFFKGNSKRCLLNTALYILAGIQSVPNISYSRHPTLTKLLLLRKVVREMLHIIIDSMRKSYAGLQKIINILIF